MIVKFIRKKRQAEFSNYLSQDYIDNNIYCKCIPDQLDEFPSMELQISENFNFELKGEDYIEVLDSN